MAVSPGCGNQVVNRIEGENMFVLYSHLAGLGDIDKITHYSIFDLT